MNKDRRGNWMVSHLGVILLKRELGNVHDVLVAQIESDEPALVLVLIAS